MDGRRSLPAGLAGFGLLCALGGVGLYAARHAHLPGPARNGSDPSPLASSKPTVTLGHELDRLARAAQGTRADALRALAAELDDLTAAGLSVELSAIDDDPPQHDTGSALRALGKLRPAVPRGAEPILWTWDHEPPFVAELRPTRPVDGPKPAPLTKAAWVRIADAVSAHDDALAAILATDGWARARPFFQQQPAWGCFKCLTRQLAIRAFADGALDRSLDGWETIERLARLIQLMRWPSPTARLVRDGQVERLADAIGFLLPHATPRPERRKRLTSLLEALEDPEGLGRVYRALLQRMVLASLHHAQVPGAQDAWDAALAGEHLASWSGWTLPTDRRLAEAAMCARNLGRVIRATRRPAPAALAEARAVSREARRWFYSSKAPLTDATKSLHFHREMWGNRLADDVFEREWIARAALRMSREALALSALATLPEHAHTLRDPLSRSGRLGWRRTSARTGLLWSIGTEGTYAGEPFSIAALERRHAPEGTVLRFQVRLP